MKQAADQLTRASMAGGREVFENEEKYFDFLKTKIRKPKKGW